MYPWMNIIYYVSNVELNIHSILLLKKNRSEHEETMFIQVNRFEQTCYKPITKFFEPLLSFVQKSHADFPFKKYFIICHLITKFGSPSSLLKKYELETT